MNGTGFPEHTGDEALVPITSNPRTPQVVDEYGNQTFYGTTDNADANFPLDSRIVEFIEYGVLNGAFARGPADPNHDITDINPLQDWTGPTSVSGGAITAQWVTDASSPSGYNLRFTVNAGAASDEAYFEQIVPIGGDRSAWTGLALRTAFYRVTGTGTGFLGEIKARYLDATGATLGSDALYVTSALNADATLYPAFHFDSQVQTAPATARFLRIRLHMLRSTAAATATATVDIPGVRMDGIRPFYGVSDAVDNTTYQPARIEQSSGVLKISDGFNNVSAKWDSAQSSWYLANGGVQWLVEMATPATPASGYHAIYAKADSRLYSLSDGGTERLLYGPADSPSFVTVTASTSVNLTGGQIAFPATQVASADANTLDDYEEGTFTPVLAYATVGSSSWAVTTQVGYYTKVGRCVTFYGVYQGVPTNGTGAGNLQMSGFPFTSQNTTGSVRFAVEFQGYTKANFTQITGNLAVNSTVANFRASGSAQTTATLAVGDIPSAGTLILGFNGSYFV